MTHPNWLRRIALVLARAANAPTRNQRRALVFLGAAGAGLAACLWLSPSSWASPSASSGHDAPAVGQTQLAHDGGCEH